MEPETTYSNLGGETTADIEEEDENQDHFYLLSVSKRECLPLMSSILKANVSCLDTSKLIFNRTEIIHKDQKKIVNFVYRSEIAPDRINLKKVQLDLSEAADQLMKYVNRQVAISIEFNE